jgi:hypothetical protein
MPIHVTTSTTQSLSNKTFVDHLSTTGVAYASGGNSNQWNSAYTTVNANSATWGTGGGSTIDTGVRALTADWQSTYTTVNANSATWGTGGGGTGAGVISGASYTRWQLTGNPPISSFSIPGAVSNESGAYRVTIGSILQDPASYSVDATLDTITFGEAPSLSANIIVLETVISTTSGSSSNTPITLTSSVSGVLSASGQQISGVDPNADRILFWDDSESKLAHLSVGSGLSISDTTLSTTGGGTKTYAVFTSLDNQPPASGFATLDTRNSIAVLDFDDASTESAIFMSVLPEAAVTTSGLIVIITWMATSATSGNCRWSVSFEKCTSDLDTDSFDTAAATNAATNGTSGVPTTTSITITTIDSLVASDLFRVRVQRVGGDGGDTMSGDAELLSVEVRSAA